MEDVMEEKKGVKQQQGLQILILIAHLVTYIQNAINARHL